jgi:hypothetical protein
MGTAVYNGMVGYFRIFTTSPQWRGPVTPAGSSVASGAYYAWAINNNPNTYPPMNEPGAGFTAPLFYMPLRWGLKRGMVPIAGTGA